MARIGELLVEAGLLTVEQLDQALRAQVLWGGRLGTNLIELKLVDLDTLSSILGQQRGLPAALARHFDSADSELQQRLSPEIAERYSCVPLLRVGAAREQVAVASIEPLGPRARGRIADDLLVDPGALVNATAAELRIYYHLERVYRIPRDARYLRARGTTRPPFPFAPVDDAHDEPVEELDVASQVDAAFDALGGDDEHTVLQPQVTVTLPPEGHEPSQPLLVLEDSIIPVEVVDDFDAEAATSPPFAAEAGTFSREVPTLDDVAGRDHVASAPQDRSGRERRRYIRTIADEPSGDSAPIASLARLKIRRIARPAADVAEKLGATIGEATRAIRRAIDRDKVADLAVEAIQRFVPPCRAAMVLVVRGETAIGWKGFCRSGVPIVEVGVPLDQPGLLLVATQQIATTRSPLSELTSIDRLLVEALHADADRDAGDLVVVPIAIANQVMCLVAMLAQPGSDPLTAESIANAAGAAFTRLMRHASR